MSLATVIPVEIVNHILSFRPRHPDAKLILNYWYSEWDGREGEYTFIQLASILRYRYRNPRVFKNMLAPEYKKNQDKEYCRNIMSNNINIFGDYTEIYYEYGTDVDYLNNNIYGNEYDDCSVCGEFDKYYDDDLDDWVCSYCHDNTIWCEKCRSEVIVGEGETLEDYLEEDLIYCRRCLDN